VEPTPDELDKIARQRAKSKYSFYVHAAVFAAVNAALFLTGKLPVHPWESGAFVGWSIGLTFHGLAAFLLRPKLEHMVEIERRRLDDDR